MSNTNSLIPENIYIQFTYYSVKNPREILYGNIRFDTKYLFTEGKYQLSKLGAVWYLTIPAPKNKKFKILSNPNFKFYIKMITTLSNLCKNKWSIYKLLYKEQNALLIEICLETPHYYQYFPSFPLILIPKYLPHSNTTIHIEN